MNKFKIFFFGILLSIPQMLIGQNKQQFTSSDTIPFILTNHNNIAIQSILNKEDTLNLMLHTAANSLSLIKKTAKNLTSINWNSEEEVNSWGGKTSSRFSKHNFLQINNLEWDSISIWESENSGPTTDGKFGLNLFDKKVIEFNFDQSALIIHKTLPKEMSTYNKMPLIFENGFMFIEGRSMIGGVSYDNRFLIHSGYGGSILFDDKFVEESKIGQLIEITDEKELKDSYGNVLKTKKGKLPHFILGEEQFIDIPAGFFEGSIGRQKMSVMGADILKRFNLIIDSNREYIYLKPSQLRDVEYAKI